MNKYRTWSVILILVVAVLGWFVYASQIKKSGFVSHFPFKLGLDLAGGTQLTYRADINEVKDGDIKGALESLKDVIERRVNLFGVSEPVVQIEGANSFSSDNKLIVELPGVTDINEAIKLIGQTPVLEFKLEKAPVLPATGTASTTLDDLFASTGLTGRYLERAQLEYQVQGTAEPYISLTFNSEGAKLLAELTKNNVGKTLAIFLDNELISAPVIQGEVDGGKAQIVGRFTPQEARTLVRNLNYGALPVPIELIGTQTIGPSLGSNAVNAGIMAGIIGFAVVALFLILWYRLPGFIATIALLMYVILSLVVFKLIPVTLTAAGIAGFILSMGMAVDANILIFERMKEELRKGKSLYDALHEGFNRAWLSIRDSNISSMITAIVLFWLGTSAIKGFALTFGLGVLISMFTAITASRTLLFALAPNKGNKFTTWLFGTGFSKSSTN